jgi:hypothetical protein
MKTKIIIGVDPDLHKSGIAIMKFGKFVEITTLPIWKLFDCLLFENSISESSNGDIIVFLEYPDNTNTYHAGGKGAALNVGKNQAIAIIIKEFLDEVGIKYKLLKPSGYSNFFKDEKFFKQQTKWEGRTNNDARSAAAMVWQNK